MVLRPYYALTGFDAISALFGIGKKKAWKVFVEDSEAQQELAGLGEKPLLTESLQTSCETFVCSLYTTARRLNNADDARYFLFCRKNKGGKDLSPTSDSLSQHIKRADFHVHIWNNALNPMLNLPPPNGLGWKLKEIRLLSVLMTKSPAAEGITD